MTVERIEAVFQRRKAAGQTALVAYLTVGDPNVEESYQCAKAALEAGADLLELGVPFSDPTADGPVIAAAAYRAIHHGGSLRAALKVAERLRAERQEPIVLFSYYNPIFAFGAAELPAAAAALGVDGLLLVDVPPEEARELRDAADTARLAIIPLIAPTTGPERVKHVLSRASGFVYYVSVTGVTGSGVAPLAQAGQAAVALRESTGLPVVVGFGITSAEKARLVADQGVDGVVVGTAIVEAISRGTNVAERVANVRTLVGAIRAGLDAR